MSLDFSKNVVKDYAKLLSTGDYSDVIIQIGEYPDYKEYQAHSLILRTRSSYFETSLSTTWSKNVGENMIISKPNFKPKIFEIILKYIYVGKIFLEDLKNTEIFDLLISCDELCLQEVMDPIQDYILTKRCAWLEKNLAFVYNISFKLSTLRKLQTYWNVITCHNPDVLLNSSDFFRLDQEVLLHIVRREDFDVEELGIEEIELWKKLIHWAIFRISNNKKIPCKDISELGFEPDEFSDLCTKLDQFVKYINFYRINAGDFYHWVKPFKILFSEDLYEDLLHFHLSPGTHRGALAQYFSRRFKTKNISIDSIIVRPYYLPLICTWIRKEETSFIKTQTNTHILYDFKLLSRGGLNEEGKACMNPNLDLKTFLNATKCKGPTLILMEINHWDEDDYTVCGVYNPLDWCSHLPSSSLTNEEKSCRGKMYDGFIFNLDNEKICRVQDPRKRITKKYQVGYNFSVGTEDLNVNEEMCSSSALSINLGYIQITNVDSEKETIIKLNISRAVRWEIFQVIEKVD
ncbi:1913_t:CDS:2 [Acaulospora morrowiae]|uniref:1913_t:CDS:1 n=1 Tax=Acaulospora morrowiae TaxID=94023 RepID=A0A9N9CCY6_9GLOM|nr:1913_t:CDS:2 [Acaulospora morrowiae]